MANLILWIRDSVTATVKYSICISHFNNAKTVRKSLDSVLNQLNNDYEVVVVDNLSSDGSQEILREYKGLGRVELIEEKSTRGKARQIAFDHSKGDYIITNMDMDDDFLPNLKILCEEYHQRYEGLMLRVRRSPYEDKEIYTSITIAPRELIARIGGWKDTNWNEDADLWIRAKKMGKFIEINFPIVAERGKHPERRTLIGRLKHRYLVYRDGFLVGYIPAPPNKMQLPIYMLARIDAKFRRLGIRGHVFSDGLA